MRTKLGKATVMIAVLLLSMALMAYKPIDKVEGAINSLTTQQQRENSFSILSTPPSTEWNRTYGGALNEMAFDVVQTSDGGYAIVGLTSSFGAGPSDFWLVKTDPAGNMEWNMTYGGADGDWASSLVQTSDGGYAMAGTTSSFGDRYGDILLVKTDSAGNMEWNKTYGRRPYYSDEANSLVQTSDGGYAIAGSTVRFVGTETYSDFWLVKTNSTGEMEWNKTYGGIGAVAYSLVQTSDGGYAMAGKNEFTGPPFTEFWLVKTDSAGNMEWNKTYGGASSDCAYSLVQTSDGGYAMAGTTSSFGDSYGDFWLVKTDSAGNMEWNKTYGEGSPFGEVALDMVQTSDGGYAIVGRTLYPNFEWNIWLVKTDSVGNMEWNTTYGGADADEASSLVQTSDGGYAIAGTTQSFGAGYYDFWLIKVGPTPPPMHDVAVNDVTSSKTVVGQGYSMNVNVTVANQGDYTETFNVTLYANTTIIETREITLTSGNSTTLTFLWNTTGFAKGNYTISAYAWPVPGEIDTGDNILTDGWVIVSVVGDITGPIGLPDGICDMRDIYGLVLRYMRPDRYDPNWDINNDGLIDMKDIYTAVLNYCKPDP